MTKEALVAAMAYVDLNPVRAELAQRIEAIRDTSIRDRLLENSAEALADYLRPVLSGLDGWSTAADPPPRAVVAVEAHVDGETVTFDLDDVASGSPSEGDREEAAQEDPARPGPKRPKRNPRGRLPAPNRTRRSRSPGDRVGGRVPTSRSRSTSTWCAPWPRWTQRGRRIVRTA